MDTTALQNEDIGFDGGSEHELRGETPTAHFPVIIFGFAVFSDLVIDPMMLGLELTGIGAALGWVLGWFVSIVLGFTIFLWIFSKSSSVQRKMMRWLVPRIGVMIVVSGIPGVDFIVPETTILVLLTHLKEKKVVTQLLSSLEKIEKIAK